MSAKRKFDLLCLIVAGVVGLILARVSKGWSVEATYVAMFTCGALVVIAALWAGVKWDLIDQEKRPHREKD